MKGKILITGGAGFLGRGIMRQAAREGWDAKFTIFSRDELKQSLCRQKYPGATYILGDVVNVDRLALAMTGHDIVIHAAALKFIPEGEFNANECVRVNIDGARSVVDAARMAGVNRVVGISTDKAAQPINIYGMTKAVMERLFAEAANSGGVTFTTCRYGNVIGSTGSVVPVMMEQWKKERTLYITNPQMTRFWMPVRSAVDTIEQALLAPPGTTVVCNPLSASMLDVATAILLALEEPTYRVDIGGGDSRLKIVGHRPGEKMHEDLVSSYEMYRAESIGEYTYIMPPGNDHYWNGASVGITSATASIVMTTTLAEWIKDSLDV